MTWGEVRVGDVVHYNPEGRGGLYSHVESWSYVVLAIELGHRDGHVNLKLLNLDTGRVVRDDRDAFMDMPEPLWTLERAEGGA